jgi:hypothetical protein
MDFRFNPTHSIIRIMFDQERALGGAAAVSWHDWKPGGRGHCRHSRLLLVLRLPRDTSRRFRKRNDDILKSYFCSRDLSIMHCLNVSEPVFVNV